MKFRYLIILIFLVSCCTACAPTIKNFPKYEKQFLPKSAFLPDQKALDGKAPKIVVFALDENGNLVASQAGLGISIANDLENVLSQNRLADLVDRGAATKLQKEIALSEMNKTGIYKGPQVADYAISGTISNASFNSKYSSGSTFVNPRTRAVVTIPPKFNYYSNVSGNIKIYELPSLAVVDAIEFSGSKSRSENVQQKGGLSLGGLQIGGEQAKGDDRDDGLVRQAGADAVDNVKVDIKNSLAKKGYILEKRVYDGKTIFKISLGSMDGIKHGDKFEVTGQYEIENPITNQSEIERRVIAEGTVTDKIDPKSCWVVIDDSDKIDSIRLGDMVKMKYKKSSFASMGKIMMSMLQ